MAGQLKVDYVQTIGGNPALQLSGVEFQTGGGGGGIEFGAGLAVELKRSLSLYAEVLRQTTIGSSGFSGWQALKGLCWAF